MFGNLKDCDLPEKVKNAIDNAEKKNKHSKFWYKLENLNERIKIYRSEFYENTPIYEKTFNEK